MTATSSSIPVWLAPVVIGGILVLGAYLVAVIDAAALRAVAGGPRRAAVLVEPFRRGALALVRQRSTTERPDTVLTILAPAALAGVAAAGLAVVPLSRTWIVADVPAGIVWWGAMESLAVVAVFLHGWAPNSVQPLIAGYRYVAGGLSVLLLSMFVLIGAGVHAQSLRIDVIVADQQALWNVIRQPLGLPLFVVVALAITSSRPIDLADAADQAGGTTAEASGMPLALWEVARRALLGAFAAMGAAVFLGGWWGPVLPGAAWMAVKTLVLLVVLVAAGHLLARVRAERFITLCWTVLLPLAFVDLAIAGLESL